MRLRTDGNYAYRLDEIEAVADLFDRNKTDSVIRACEHARRDARAKEHLAKWLIEEHRAGRLTDAQLKEIADSNDSGARAYTRPRRR